MIFSIHDSRVSPQKTQYSVDYSDCSVKTLILSDYARGRIRLIVGGATVAVCRQAALTGVLTSIFHIHGAFFGHLCII